MSKSHQMDFLVWRGLSRGGVDVVILDVKMPGMNGIQVLSEIRRLSLPTRVILMTGHFSLPDEENTLKSGAFAYLLKPYPVLKLVELIERAATRKMSVSES